MASDVIYSAIVGSRAYGLEVEGSDTDRRGIYLAPTARVLSVQDVEEQHVDDAAQTCYWELKKFLLLALKANPTVLEVLFSPLVERVEKPAEELLAMRDVFLSKLAYATFNGYAISQFEKMQRSLGLKQRPNWKHAMHLIRLLESGTRLLETGTLDLRTRHREELLEIRSGTWSWEQVDARRKLWHERMETAYRGTTLPEMPEAERVNDYLVRTRIQALGSTP